MKVRHLAVEHIEYCWSAEAIKKQHPDLSLAAIYAALAYYYDNQKEIEQEITEDLRFANDMRTKLEDPVLQNKLSQLKKD